MSLSDESMGIRQRFCEERLCRADNNFARNTMECLNEYIITDKYDYPSMGAL